MKKFIVGCGLVCLIAVQVSAQIPTFVKGDNVVGAGIGFGGNLYSGLVWSGVKSTPAILAHYERCIVDNLWDEKSSIGVGGQIGYASAKWEYHGGLYGWKRSDLNIGVRGALHYALVDKLDTYAGVVFAYNIVTWEYWGVWGTESKSSSPSSLRSSFFAGARYYFTDSFGAFAELGYGVSIFNIGLSLKF